MIHGAAAALLARFVYFTITYATAWLLAESRGSLRTSFLELWDQWDTQHFLGIAQHGYFGASSGENWAAFFPLYPLAVRPLLWLGVPEVAAGLLVSAISSAVALGFLYRLVAEERDSKTATRSLFYLAAFPTGVFLIAAYSESLFLAGAVAAFYYARRGRWLATAVPAAVATGSRIAGLFLVAGLIVEFLRQRDFRADRVLDAVTALALSLVPVALFGAFLTRTAESPMAYFEAQREGWSRGLTSPWNSLVMTVNNVQPDTPTNWALIFRLELVGAAIGVGFVAWAVLRREWGYATFIGLTLAVMLSSSWYFSVPRILVTFFPAVIFLAESTRGRPTAHAVLISILSPLAAMGAIVFTQGRWYF